MATIKVIAKVGDTHHPKYGELVKGSEYEIDENDFGDELFARPEGWTPPWEREKDAGQVKTSKKKKEE